MYTMHNIIHKTLCLGLLLCCALTALGQSDSSALNYLLQRPPVAKHYDDKKFGDHVFVEIGMGANSTAKGACPYLEVPGMQAGGAIGDWVTPLHGWRIGVNGGTRVLGRKTTKTLGVSADYLLNITALSQRQYNIPRTWEFIATAGVGYSLAHWYTDTRYALHTKLGLRAQVNIHDYTYIYLEPQLGLVSNDLYNVSSWRGYRIAGKVNAGLGYRLVKDTRRQDTFAGNSHFLDNTFAQISGGPAFLFTSSPKNWGRTLGGHIQGHLGKWWDPYSATRIGLGVGLHRRDDKAKNKSFSASLGYMLNMHNVFGGYKPDRKYWVNGVIDVTGNLSASNYGKHYTAGIGAGLQGHFKISKNNTFFLEPRVDLMHGDYMQGYTTVRNWDLIPALHAGFNFMEQGDIKTLRARNQDFKSPHAYDHLFVEAGLGAAMPITGHTVSHMGYHLRPVAHLGVGKWFHPTSGVRLWSEATQYINTDTKRYKAIALGADYLWHITNTMMGYEPGHRFEMIASAGINTAVRQYRRHAFFGGNLGLRAQWNANQMWGFYIEPQARIYGNNFLERSQFSAFEVDVVGHLSAGVQANLRHYDAQQSRQNYQQYDRHAFVSAAGGVETNGLGLRARSQYGPLGRLSVGNWYSPISAWRVNISGFEKENNNRRYARIMAGADYMLDLSTMGMGYNPDRYVTLRGIAGVDFGADLECRGRGYFLTELHGGAQLAVRAGKGCEIYVEPQIGYELSGKNYRGRMQHIIPRAYAGVNWKLHTAEGKHRKEAAPERNQFVSLNVGTGFHTGTLNASMPFGRKLNIDASVAYGRWYNAVSGWSAGITNTTILTPRRDNANITSLHGDYLFNILTIAGGKAQLNSRAMLNGYVGASLNIAARPDRETRIAPGLRAGLQIGGNVGKNWSIYAEPHANITTKNIWVGSTHPADGQVGLMVGTKYRF